MKRFLLTWYGLTDFRASLGFENTEGPVARALEAASYSDIVVLGYTRADNDSNELIEAQKTFALELASIHSMGQQNNWQITNRFVSKFANTAVAHEYFKDWLKKNLLPWAKMQISA